MSTKCRHCGEYFDDIEEHVRTTVSVNGSRTQEEAPLCECGCGEQVKSKTNGIWARWRPGHSHRRTVFAIMPEPADPDYKPRMGEPWCPQHRMHPKDCFEIHYPHSTSDNIRWLRLKEGADDG